MANDLTIDLGTWIGIAWLLWALYWVAASFSVKAVRKREDVSSRILHVLPLAIAGVLLANRMPGLLGQRFIAPGGPCALIALAMSFAGLAFSIWARVHLAGNWSGTVTLKAGHELVRSGPYAFVRHPIYTGLLLALFGTALATGAPRGLLAFVIAGAALLRKLRVEERWLAEEFGAAYEAYRREVSALVPGLY
jgi:protein-S-isoprenylcysteine O-methyltransferase Ste14